MMRPGDSLAERCERRLSLHADARTIVNKLGEMFGRACFDDVAAAAQQVVHALNTANEN